MAKHIAGARYVELPGDDHLPFVGDQDAMLDEIEEFLTGVRHGAPSPTGCWRPSCSPTSSARPSRAAELGDRRWREAPRRPPRRGPRASSNVSGAVRSTPPATGSSRHSTGPRGPYAARRRSGPRLRNRASRFARASTPASARCTASDVAGIAVHMGARVAALASAGEVLVSSTVKDLVAGSGIEFEDRGVHELKGIPGEWRLYAVS